MHALCTWRDKVNISVVSSFLLIGVLGTAAPQAVALVAAPPPSGWGSIAQVSTYSNCPGDSCFSNGTQHSDTWAGGEFRPSLTIANNTFGRASASASFAAGSSWLPELRVYANSGLGRGADGQVFASQRFVYSGAGEEVTLAINLHGDVIDGPTGLFAR